MPIVRSVCVYCGSSNTADQRFKDLAADLGKMLAEQGIILVFGGGHVGLMGIIADACMKAGGQVVGIMTDFLCEREGAHTGITELQVVKTMHERKHHMFERSEAFVIMPGGFGTLDEAFEIITWRQVGLHNKPIIWLNAFDYWQGLLNNLVTHMVNQGFVRPIDQKIYTTVTHVHAILPAIQQEMDYQSGLVSIKG